MSFGLSTYVTEHTFLFELGQRCPKMTKVKLLVLEVNEYMIKFNVFFINALAARSNSGFHTIANYNNRWSTFWGSEAQFEFLFLVIG